MIRISQLKLPPGHTQEELENKIKKELRLNTGKNSGEGFSFQVIKRSIDARKKPEIFLSYTVDVRTGLSPEAEQRLIGSCRNGRLGHADRREYRFPEPGEKALMHRPVIVGTGPAGLFCGYMLACHGYRPLLLERGMDVDRRVRAVEVFWQGGRLDEECNVQFGEGGAGAFSDGKLNTLVKDRYGRNRKALDIFVEAGAPENILYEGKPHVGTDILVEVVKNLRRTILKAGGEIRFGVKAADLLLKNGRVRAVVAEDVRSGRREEIPAEAVVLAIGHSARDTFQMLCDKQIPMEAKPFAVGLRVEHPQELIDLSQYGRRAKDELPPAAYRLAAQTKEGRSVYSFCMCPGGYVVNASSEKERLAVNGMSYSRRDGQNANSAVVVSVTPEDFPDRHPLSGVAFQRRLEEKAYRAGQGKVPVERYGDFKRGVERRSGVQEPSGNIWKEETGRELLPRIKGGWQFAPVHEILPEALNRAFIEGMEQFGRRIEGFSQDGVLLSGIESRTSSPVRILRDESGQSQLRGLYPCGEGAGYAGGITSAAMDGIKTAELIAGEYRPFGGTEE